ncbi:MAG: histidine phosphatase family protein [Patescibacteria group bacterium]
MKRIYFVRHGESEGNLQEIIQHPEEPLTEEGRRQAGMIAKRCHTFSFDKIIASTHLRAKETAEIIAETTKKEITFSDFFVELRRPSEIIGKSRNSPEVKKIYDSITVGLGDPLFRHSDEENFEDVKERGMQALAFLIDDPAEHILAVTHGAFLRMLGGLAVFGDDLTFREYRRIFYVFQVKNTGVTVFEYHPEYPSLPWRIVTWNDHAHLD